MILTTSRIIALRKLWFKYGNGGSKHTHGNHRLLQVILENHQEYLLNSDIITQFTEDLKFFSGESRNPQINGVSEECYFEIIKIFNDQTLA